MMDCFLPEGRPSTTRRPADDALAILLDAYSSGQILEGQAISCSADHDLTVQFGNITGVIPRVETALGIEEGATKEIAILSRVGKPVCFTRFSISTPCRRAQFSQPPSLIWSRSALFWMWAAAW